MQDNFFKTDQQYGRGFKVDEYNGQYSLVSCQQGKDGGIYNDWVMVQDRDLKPKVKQDGSYVVIPVKVLLGKSVNEAIASIEQILLILKGSGGTPAHPPHPAAGGGSYYTPSGGNPPPPPPEGDDVPF